MVRQTARKLLSTEREDLIVRCVSEGLKTVGELVSSIGVSEATVRRDLENLEARGRLCRVHGGAELPRVQRQEPLFTEKAALHAENKMHIARLAAAEIKDGDTIFLDGGSTVLELARHLSEKKNLTVVTNSLMAAAELMETDCRLIIVGGEFRALSRTLVGPLTFNMLSSIRIGKAFLGTMGISREHGLTTTDVNEAYTKRLAAQSSDKVYILADSSKFGKVQFVKTNPLSEIDAVITDPAIPETDLKYLKKLKKEIIL